MLIPFWFFEGTFTSFFKDKKSKRSHKTVEIKVFLHFGLLVDGRIRIRTNQRYTEIIHDPLLFSVAQGIFWLSTERLSRSTIHLKEGREGSLHSWLCSLATMMSWCNDPSVQIVTKSPKVGPFLIFSISLVQIYYGFGIWIWNTAHWIWQHLLRRWREKEILGPPQWPTKVENN